MRVFYLYLLQGGLTISTVGGMCTLRYLQFLPKKSFLFLHSTLLLLTSEVSTTSLGKEMHISTNKLVYDTSGNYDHFGAKKYGIWGDSISYE